MRSKISINGVDYLLRIINNEEKRKVDNLFLECKDYFIMIEGKEVDDSKSLFDDLPLNKKKSDKYPLGVYSGEKLVAVADLVKEFPTKDEWIIGLLLIHPEYRSIGLGREIHSKIAEFSKNQNAEKLRIGVVEGNEVALKFWTNIGYENLKITEPVEFGENYKRIIVMNYYL